MPAKARSKYGATPTTVDGIRFHSLKESRRYGELKLLEKAGHIRGLRLQPRYVLCALVLEGADCRDANAGTIVNRRYPVGYYVSDFEYEERFSAHIGQRWLLVVEDTKGLKLDIYKLKKRIFEAQYGIQIRET